MVLAGEELDPIPGYIVVESGKIKEIVQTRCKEPDSIIMPGLINCHTHVGDYIFKDRGLGLSLQGLMRSPGGLKHVLLSEADPVDLARGMAAAEGEMIGCGITSFLDFREQGLEGIHIFRQAIKRIRGIAFGRPVIPGGAISEEIIRILQSADGIGLDRVGVYDDVTLRTIRDAASDRIVGVHVSENRWKRDEVERALNVLSADILVHLTHVKKEEIETIAERNRGAVVCPRSNISLGVGMPPLEKLIDHGVNVGLGTDNCMTDSLNLFREMELALALMRNKRPREVLKMATITGARVAGISEETGSIEVGKDADIVMIERRENMSYSEDIHAAIVKRAGPENVMLVVRGGKIVLDRRRRNHDAE